MGTRVVKSSDCIEGVDWSALAFESEFNVERMAAQIQIPVRTLERLFKNYFGVSPHKFMTQIRLERAKSMLEQGLPVKVVAIELRYKQHSHFSREFKTFFGQSPRDMQKR